MTGVTRAKRVNRVKRVKRVERVVRLTRGRYPPSDLECLSVRIPKI